MNWDDARLFLAVARSGQMLGAARRLGLNQATLSRRIANLEAALGTTLLVRHAQGSRLTEDGAALATALERAEWEMLRAQGALARKTGASVSGVVRIGAPDGLGIAFLAPRLGVLAERHPDLTVQLVPVPRSFSLSEREADIAVFVGRPQKGRLVIRKLADYSLGLYASRDYLARRGLPTDLADLTERHRLVGYVEDLIYAPGLNYARELTRHWHAHLEISSAIGQKEAVRGGAGVGVLHDYLARSDPALVPVLAEASIIRSYWMAHHESLRDVARVRLVADFLVEMVREARAAFLPERAGEPHPPARGP